VILWRGFRILKTGRETPDWLSLFRRWVYGLSFFSLLFTIVESGLRWQLPRILSVFSAVLEYAVLLSFLSDALLTFYFTFPRKDYFRENWLDSLVLLSIFLNVVSLRAGAGFIVLRNVVVLVRVFTRTRKFSHLVRRVRINAPRAVALSFAGVILVGALLLTFPTATADGRGATFIDALFTATSATCVTGLIVQDTPTYFSFFGQIVILILIQIGGLGIMTYSTFLALILGRFTLGQRRMVQEMMEEERNVLSMVLYIFKMTFLVELIGTAILFLRWVFYFKTPSTALYYSVFHSISAFCNAGFALFSDSLSQFVSDPVINITIMGLIVLGGLGFIVVYEIVNKARNPRRQISAHTRLAVSTSAILILLGFFTIFFLEFDGALLRHTLPEKLWASLFQSVTPRTAGFNTVPIEAFSQVVLTVLIVLMFIGASPGSTGGGIKTTTFAILLLSLASTLRGKQDITVYRRTVSGGIVQKTLALLVSALLVVGVFFILLLAVEKRPFLPLLFETVSAFGTVGLSTGITPTLTSAGKMLVLLLMYVGRIGPLTLGLALAARVGRAGSMYPEARVMIG
jgi:trk system potassium uptake protein TrkH